MRVRRQAGSVVGRRDCSNSSSSSGRAVRTGRTGARSGASGAAVIETDDEMTRCQSVRTSGRGRQGVRTSQTQAQAQKRGAGGAGQAGRDEQPRQVDGWAGQRTDGQPSTTRAGPLCVYIRGERWGRKFVLSAEFQPNSWLHSSLSYTETCVACCLWNRPVWCCRRTARTTGAVPLRGRPASPVACTPPRGGGALVCLSLVWFHVIWPCPRQRPVLSAVCPPAPRPSGPVRPPAGQPDSPTAVDVGAGAGAGAGCPAPAQQPTPATRQGVCPVRAAVDYDADEGCHSR